MTARPIVAFLSNYPVPYQAEFLRALDLKWTNVGGCSFRRDFSWPWQRRALLEWQPPDGRGTGTTWNRAPASGRRWLGW